MSASVAHLRSAHSAFPFLQTFGSYGAVQYSLTRKQIISQLPFTAESKKKRVALLKPPALYLPSSLFDYSTLSLITARLFCAIPSAEELLATGSFSP